MEALQDGLRQSKESAVVYKGGECQDCHGKFDDCVFDFDHRDPMMKVMDIGHMVSLGLNLEDLKPELDKCDLVCANCHRLRTNSKSVRKRIREKISLKYRFTVLKKQDATSLEAKSYDATVVLPERAELVEE